VLRPLKRIEPIKSLPQAPTPGPLYEKTWGPPVKYLKIPHGEDGTVATLKVMKKLVLGPWGSRNPEVIELTRMAVRDVSPGPEKDYRAMAQAIFDFVRENVAYRLDPSGLEYVYTPWYTLLVSGYEDCESQASAVAAMAMALGLRAGFRTVKGDKRRPDQWSHVYAVIGIPEKGKTVWLTADTTQKEAYLGWDPPEAKLYGKKTWVIDPGVEDIEWDS
jgi:transglutaminase-like putative cysteine protease